MNIPHSGRANLLCMIVIISLLTKFEVPSAIRSKNMIGVQKITTGHVTLTSPTWGGLLF